MAAALGLVLTAPSYALCTGDPATPPSPAAISPVDYLRSYRAQFHSPTRIASDSSGNIFVTDPVNGRVFGRDASGLAILDLSGLGYPVSVAASADVLYVGDRETGSVMRYTLTGNLLGYLGQGDGEFLSPQDIAIDPATGDVFVVDSEADRIRRYDALGTWEADLGNSGSGDGEFNFPSAIHVLGDEVFVVDQRNNRIQVLDRDGNFNFCINSQVTSCIGFGCQCGGGFSCSRKRQFDQGIAIDNEGRVLVTDGFEGKVYAMDRRGVISTVIGNFNQLRIPTDITIDPSGRLFVASANQARLDVFGLGTYTDPEQYAGARLDIPVESVDRDSTIRLEAFLEVPGYRLSAIDPASILANDLASPVEVEQGDFNHNTIPDLRLVFDQNLILSLPTGRSLVSVSAAIDGTAPPLRILAGDTLTLAGDLDTDGDGVLDSLDHCADTLPGDVVSPDGCSLDQLCPCEGPVDGSTWKNHGQYMKCITHTVKMFADLGRIARQDTGTVVSNAANSQCGQ